MVALLAGAVDCPVAAAVGMRPDHPSPARCSHRNNSHSNNSHCNPCNNSNSNNNISSISHSHSISHPHLPSLPLLLVAHLSAPVGPPLPNQPLHRTHQLLLQPLVVPAPLLVELHLLLALAVLLLEVALLLGPKAPQGTVGRLFDAPS